MTDFITPSPHAIQRWQEWAVEPNPERARRRLLYAAHHGQEVEPPAWVRQASERNRRSIYRFHRGWILVLVSLPHGDLTLITCYRIQPGDRWAPVVGNRVRPQARWSRGSRVRGYERRSEA